MRVCIVPEYPMSLMTGGLQVQAVETCKALSSLGGGMTAELFDWSKTETPCDLYHFIGFPDHLHRIAELVNEAGRATVLTMLFGGTRDRVQMRIAAARRAFSSRVLRKRGRDRAIARAKSIITITESDAEAAHIVFGVERTRITVVPHGIADGYFRCTTDAWHKAYGDSAFVLCVGAVQPRKNQLLLAQVCNDLRLPLVLIGPTLPGQSEYAHRVGESMRRNESFGGQWLQHLRNDDEILQSAYAACRVFALLSTEETQPISVMQAMAARRPVLLLKASYADDNLFRDLPQAASCDVQIVADSLKQVWDRQQAADLPPDYSWRSVARRLQTIYNQALNSN
jgi:glycosyltransferase involved in cell wall biosynthesis